MSCFAGLQEPLLGDDSVPSSGPDRPGQQHSWAIVPQSVNRVDWEDLWRRLSAACSSGWSSLICTALISTQASMCAAPIHPVLLKQSAAIHGTHPQSPPALNRGRSPINSLLGVSYYISSMRSTVSSGQVVHEHESLTRNLVSKADHSAPQQVNLALVTLLFLWMQLPSQIASQMYWCSLRQRSA